MKDNEVIEIIKKNHGNKEIVFWGYNKRLLDVFTYNNLDVCKVFSANQKLVNDETKSISDYRTIPSYVKSSKTKLLFFFPDKESNCKTQKSFLIKNGIDIDQIFFMTPSKNRFALDEKSTFFSDAYGNTIIGSAKNLSFGLLGSGNNITIDENVKVDKKLLLEISSSNNNIHIGKECHFKGAENILQFVSSEGGCYCDIREGCAFTRIRIIFASYATLNIGKECTFAEDCRFSLNSNAHIQIGDDCMFSTDIILQPCDGHSIMDLETKSLMNSPKINNHDLIIDNHVWIGRRAFVLGKTHISEGSIIGAQSTVKGRFPNNVVIAGNPGKVVRKNVAWSRNPYALKIEKYNGYTKMTQSF